MYQVRYTRSGRENSTEISIIEAAGISRYFVLAELMPGFPLIELTMLAAYVNLYAMVSIRHAETAQSEQVYTRRAIDKRYHITLAKLIPSRIIGPYATLYLCYVNSRAVDCACGLDSWSEFTRIVLQVSM